MFSELLARVVERFRAAISVERECVTWIEPALIDRTVPLVKQSQDGASGLESFKRSIAAQHKPSEMAAIHVAETL